MLTLMIFLIGINYISPYSVPDVTNGLDINGDNVCTDEDQITKNIVVSTTQQVLTTEKYETCCRRFIFCVKYCNKTRTTVRTVTEYRTTMRLHDRKTYRCCSGWTRENKDDTSCTKPICDIDCRNGGKCVKPNTCQCQKGYEGKYCQLDVNECQTIANNCEQTCVNLKGGFKCACKRGFTLNDDKATCTDIDECAQSPCSCVSDDQCQAKCLNTPGSYKCQCPKGFFLNSADQCEDLNECLSWPKEKLGCKQYCENTPGSYQCKCEQGFQGKDCTDINECAINNGGCSDNCHNIEGSYVCSCPDGFYLESDQKSCKVINSTSFKRQYVCESDGMGMLECPHLDQKIVVINAMYGRLSDKVCQNNDFKSNLRCSSKNPMEKLKACNGLASCVFFFPYEDPCPGVEKYYDIVYDCVKN